MKKSILLYGKALFILFFILALTACATSSADDLYALPQGADEYVQLQQQLNVLLSQGAEYSPPISGNYRQAVQFEDLDKDGNDEAIVFLNMTGESKPLKVYVYQKVEDEFIKVAVIEGEGTSFESVNYIDMNNDGAKEIVVGRQISTSVKILTAYSTKEFQMSAIINTDYIEYSPCSMTQQKGDDLFVLRNATDQNKEAVLYSFSEDGVLTATNTRLSRGAAVISRLRTTTLEDGKSAVIVEGRLDTNMIFTDIFALSGGKLKNITIDVSTGASDETFRSYEIYCRDINSDGKVEIPYPIQIPSQNEGASYWLIQWYLYDSSGQRQLVMTTFSNNTDGWMLAVPDDWTEDISVRRTEYVSGEQAVIFSYTGDGEEKDFLAIYTLSGENRVERAKLTGRFVLTTEAEQIYVARIFDAAIAEKLDIDAATVRENFSIIYSEWNTGET